MHSQAGGWGSSGASREAGASGAVASLRYLPTAPSHSRTVRFRGGICLATEAEVACGGLRAPKQGADALGNLGVVGGVVCNAAVWRMEAENPTTAPIA